MQTSFSSVSTAKLSAQDTNPALKLIGPDDPPVCEIIEGNSPFLLLGVHTGNHTPDSLIDVNGNPLGLAPEILTRTNGTNGHQFWDPGTGELIENLRKLHPDANVISTKWSRLVADLNRKKPYAITTELTELNIPIPFNDPETGILLNERIDELYAPFFKEFGALVSRIKSKHGFVIILAPHSYKPEWNGVPRHKEIGTAYGKESEYTQLVNASLSNQKGHLFKAHYPYDLQTGEFQDTTTGEELAQTSGISCIVIEMRSDCLQDPQKNLGYAQTLGTLMRNIEQSLYFKWLQKQTAKTGATHFSIS